MKAAKPNDTRGRIALPDVDLRDRKGVALVPVGGSELSLVAELRGQDTRNAAKSRLALGSPRR
jgi:hypothetical protein